MPQTTTRMGDDGVFNSTNKRMATRKSYKQMMDN